MSKSNDLVELFHQAEPLFIALGDPNRQQIVVQLLQTHKLSVNQIADATPLSRPAISHHLKVLRQASLISVERAGTQRLYCIADEAVQHLDLLEALVGAMRDCTNWQTNETTN
jgi:ArsR family transcriptional regulator